MHVNHVIAKPSVESKRLRTNFALELLAVSVFHFHVCLQSILPFEMCGTHGTTDGQVSVSGSNVHAQIACRCARLRAELTYRLAG